MKNYLITLLLLLTVSFSGMATTYYVATGGNDSNSGTSTSSPFATLEHAVEQVSAGDYIYLRGGTYSMTVSSLVIQTSGTSSNNIHVYAYDDEVPVLQFDDDENSSSRGIVMDGDYWHWKGIVVEYAGDNGMLLSGNNNTIEDCIFRYNHDTGLQLSRYDTDADEISEWPTDNLIVNCEAHDNADSDEEDADGFAAKLTCGEGNVFRGCVSHHNIDDGWDLYTKSTTGEIGVVVFEDCIAHNNGTLSDGSTTGSGDKNGFKLGSSSNYVNHELYRCIAFNNGKHGFTDNGNVGSIKFYNLTSYNNGDYNYHTRDDASHVFRNCITLDGNHTDRIVGDASTSCNALDDTDYDWDYVTAEGDFQTMTPGDDSDPTANGFLQLASSSSFIDAGCSVSGISYSGDAPDLGAIEYGGEDTTDDDTSDDTEDNDDSSDDDSSDDEVITEGDYIHNFTESGTSSDFFTISGNLSTSKGTVTYNGLTLTQCLKIESSTSISFTTSATGTLTLVFNDDFSDGINIDGTSNSASSGILTVDIDAGDHTITKDDVANLYYISLTIESSDDPITATLTKHGSGSSSQTIELGESITEFYYSWTEATTVTVSGMPDGITTITDTDAQTVTFSGTPTETGTFSFTVTTVGADENASMSGTITVTETEDDIDEVITDGTYYITSVNSGHNLAVEDASTENGGNIIQETASTSESQQWVVTDLDGTNYSIINVNSGLGLDVYNFSTENGGNIAQWSYWGGENQQWQINSVGDGSFYITSLLSGLALDVYNISTESGANVMQYEYWGGTGQQWIFTEVNEDDPVYYTLTTNTSGSGSVSGAGTYEEGSTVTLTATASDGYEFSYWSGVDSYSGTTAYVTLNSDVTVTAVFVETEDDPVYYTLTANTSGSGSVSGAGTYDEGTTVTLTATANDGYEFSYWSGVDSYSGTTAYVTMNSDVTVTAVFIEEEEDDVILTIQENETGFCSVDGSIDSDNDGYSGDGFANTENASGNGIDYAITIGTAGTYTIEVQYANGSDDRPAYIMQDGSTLATLSMPASGGWSTWTSVSTTVTLSAGTSDLRLEATSSGGLANIDYITITGANVSAASCDEEETTYTLTVNTSGSGTVTGAGTYDEGTTVTLTATANDGYEFSYWSGVDSYSGTTAYVTMNSDVTVTAVFIEEEEEDVILTIEENETGFCSVDGSIDSDNDGYSGDGFANTDNASGNGIDYAITIGTAGTYTIEVQYANGSDDRPAYIMQDGSTLATLSMPASGGWSTWTSVSTTVTLSAGTSDLRLEANSSGGLANVDYITITGANVSAASCDEEETTYTLTVNTSGSGTVTGAGTYDEGTTVTLTATASDGYEFSYWSGVDSYSGTTAYVTMNSDVTVTATFVSTEEEDDDVSFAMIGFATEDGGTTGGSGGTTVYASTGDEILEYIDAKKDGDYSTGLIIMVNGTITPDNTDATKIDIKEVEDVSLIGVGTLGEFDGIGVKVYKASNVILRNLEIHHVDIGDKDCISIEGSADHIWVDHCELYNEFGDDVDKDYYDGLLDAKKDAAYITYSWNYLHDSWKTMLVGSSDSDDEDRMITAHHNIFENCNSRMPLFRFGTGHFFNNYYVDGASTAINSRMGACIRIEKNYFEDTQNPYVTAYSDEDGYGELIDNYLDNCTWDLSEDDVNELGSCTASIPYDYDDVLNSVSSVPSITRSYAGVGVLSDPSYIYTKKEGITAAITKVSNLNNVEVYPNPFSSTATIRFDLENEQEVAFRLVDMTGRVIDVIDATIYTAGTNEVNYQNFNLHSGMYILNIQYGNKVQNVSLMVQ